MVIANAKFNRRLVRVEEALYALKNSGCWKTQEVAVIDDFLALPAELKVEFYGLLVCES